jgi:putative flippase GtrA
MPAMHQAPGRTAARLSKVLRYSATSVITTVISLSLLGVLLLAITAGWANLVAVGVGSVISFELNRRWVWKQSDRKARWQQLLPFVCLSFAFLGASSLAVHAVAGALGPHAGSFTRTFLIESTTVAVFGMRWATQYLLLDRVLFRAPTT